MQVQIGQPAVYIDGLNVQLIGVVAKITKKFVFVSYSGYESLKRFSFEDFAALNK